MKAQRRCVWGRSGWQGAPACEKSQETLGIVWTILCRNNENLRSYPSDILHRMVKSILRGFLLKDYIEERAINIANYIIENNATVRQTARTFGISKSTVHKDVTDRLMQLNPGLAKQARKVLDVNKSERHIRGGMATKEKYMNQHHTEE